MIRDMMSDVDRVGERRKFERGAYGRPAPFDASDGVIRGDRGERYERCG